MAFVPIDAKGKREREREREREEGKKGRRKEGRRL
jgi:hypothetical protein